MFHFFVENAAELLVAILAGLVCLIFVVQVRNDRQTKKHRPTMTSCPTCRRHARLRGELYRCFSCGNVFE